MTEGDEEIPHGTPLTPEQEEMARLQEEVDKGVEATQLIDVSGSIYITVICSEAASIYWRPTFCNKCCKPMVVHTPLTVSTCTRSKATQHQRTLYELACKGNRTMDIVAATMAAQKREERATLAAQNTPTYTRRNKTWLIVTIFVNKTHKTVLNIYFDYVLD